MSTNAEKTSRSSDNRTPATQESSAKGTEELFGIPDQRPEHAVQRKLQQLADQSVAPIQRKENNTGLPDNLKSGIENLSGYAMDDVKVHYNSDEPERLQAHAYAQGTDIHVAPGQEKHLPHEAWHVVQQKQGRVKPTRQLKGKTAINDDAGLEKEADEMGGKALSATSSGKVAQQKAVDPSQSPVQRTINVEGTQLTTVDEVTTLLNETEDLRTNPVNRENYTEAVTELLASATAYTVADGKPIRDVARLAVAIRDRAIALTAAEEAEMQAAFSTGHRVISFRAFTLFYYSRGWEMSGVEEFNDGGKNNRNYGVCLSINKKGARSKKMYTHFHVHHNDNYTVVNAHFKSGRSKVAPQSWDIPHSANLVNWVKDLKATIGTSWTNFHA